MSQLGWKPDSTSSIPLYRQIYDFIRVKIENGEWPPGSKIPSQRKLADSFGVNRSTVIMALDELIAQGLLEGKSGGGTRVVNNSWSLLSSAPLPDWNSYVQAGIHHPNMPTVQEINRAEFAPRMIRLGTGELSPDLYPRELMAKVLEQLPARISSMGYEEPKGLLVLREELGRYLKSLGIEASPSSILIVSGALQALQLISVGLLQPGSTILLEKPSYLNSLHVFQSSGMRLFGIPLDNEGVQIKAVMEQKNRQNGALLYTIPSFHNPTGIVMTEARRNQLMETCEKERLPVIEDDVYRELWLDAPAPPPLKASDKNGLVLYLGSLSKTLSPGLRIGWLVGPEPVIDRLADIKMQTDYGSSSLAQWAAAEWLSSGMYYEHLETVRKSLKERRDATADALQKHFKDLGEWTLPTGGFYIWLQLLPSLSVRTLFEKALREGILLNPGTLYDPHAVQFLRLSYSYASLSDLTQGIRRLAELIRKMQ
ncbi:PLP-dependent aminotransferase family protein [Effusibacillus lacus]|uniref:GntR family transcriptional regulator n=1 Tax=Effusibacillus lacus TaxID=1348429 RepID=A0A292YJU6_9BACL|nr:PLP-dependent aminotransferase family protein [Effusibacillus lacus]TCS69414.1 GntR family transcriptional regulator of abcA and norABC [Effusibacillus lacus]GAX89181.1 GntR family transcriptional regulator [Effusibacillus lacus]